MTKSYVFWFPIGLICIKFFTHDTRGLRVIIRTLEWVGRPQQLAGALYLLSRMGWRMDPERQAYVSTFHIGGSMVTLLVSWPTYFFQIFLKYSYWIKYKKRTNTNADHSDTLWPGELKWPPPPFRVSKNFLKCLDIQHLLSILVPCFFYMNVSWICHRSQPCDCIQKWKSLSILARQLQIRK